MGLAPELDQQGIWEVFDLSSLSGADLGAYLDLVLARCARWFRASGGSIFLDDGEGVYRLRSKFGTADSMPNSASIARGQGVGGIVVESGMGRILGDLEGPEFSSVSVNREIASSMVLPLIDSHDNTLGVLNLSRKSGEPSFEESDLGQAMALASHLALAVANASMVSALKEQIQEAEDAKEKLVGVLDSVAGAVLVVDEDGEVVNHNEAAAKVSFLTQEEGVDLSELQSALMESVWDVLKVRKRISRQAYDSKSDRTWLVEAVPIATGGGVITVSEITEHERQQRELGRVKRLAEIGQMTAAIAHEIRNPLTGIRSAAQMIREDHEMVGEFIGMIEEEAHKLNSLCDEFLAFARPMQLNYQETTLSEVVDPILQLVRASYEEKGVILRGLRADDQPTMSVDGRKIGQVVLNLLRNALEASEAGTTVTVEVLPTRIVVTDEGEGISPESLEKLFSPFFTTKSDGTGLGLCNARKTVDTHGGEIVVESEVGQGTRFEINLDRNVA